jgi:PAS domain S-box-containing protein
VIKLPVVAVPDIRATTITPAVVWQAFDALPDGIALADDRGAIRLANRRLEQMFGYQHGKLHGRPLTILLPVSSEMLADASDAGRTPPAPLLVSGAARLTGTRKDGTAFPVKISLRPVPTRTSRLILAVIRDDIEVTDREKKPTALLDPVPPALAAQQQHNEEILDRITSGLFEVGILLSTTADMPPGSLKGRVDEAVRLLDDLVRRIYDAAFGGRGHPSDAARAPAGPG